MMLFIKAGEILGVIKKRGEIGRLSCPNFFLEARYSEICKSALLPD
jgi:hypothetical protein